MHIISRLDSLVYGGINNLNGSRWWFINKNPICGGINNLNGNRWWFINKNLVYGGINNLSST